MMEAVLIGKLNHPHIISIYDAAADDNMDYIMMKLVTNTELASLVE